MAALDAGGPAPRSPDCRPPRRSETTTIYDRRRANVDHHAAYVVVAFVAGGKCSRE